MKFIARMVVGAVALGSGVSQCQPAVRTARPHQQIFVPMDYESWPLPRFDTRPGDTVNVIMEPDAADPQGFCDERNGSLWLNPFTGILICEGVDF